MITRNEFVDLFENITSQFGDKAFSTRKKELIYNTVKHLNKKQCIELFDKLIGNSRFSPTLEDFQLLARTFKSEEVERDRSCPICDGNGSFSRFYVKNGSSYAFACSCPLGAKFGAFMKWADSPQHLFSRVDISRQQQN